MDKHTLSEIGLCVCKQSQQHSQEPASACTCYTLSLHTFHGGELRETGRWDPAQRWPMFRCHGGHPSPQSLYDLPGQPADKSQPSFASNATCR